MPDERNRRIPVTDKRRAVGEAAEPSAPEVPPADVSDAGAQAEIPEERDYLDDLRRLQADFENYRKRMMKDQAAMAARAVQRFAERLLPVLDSFERAISHGEGGEGVALVYKELRAALESEGIEEIPAEGEPFDPRVHEAVESIEDADVREPVCRDVYRRGYRAGDQVLRAAMVVVAHPPENAEREDREVE